MTRYHERLPEPEWTSEYDRPHVLVGSVEGRPVIGKRPKAGPRGVLWKWGLSEARAAFSREIAIFGEATNGAFTHLRVPALVRTDGENYFCCERVDATSSAVLRESAIDSTIRALVEFQCDLRFQERLASAAVLGFNRSLNAAVFRRSMGSVRRNLGPKNALRCYGVLLREQRRQPRLPLSFLVHGDFSPRNCLVTATNEVYLIDFRTAYFDRRWPLVDVIYYGLSMQDADAKIDHRPLLVYITSLTERLGFNTVQHLNLFSQVRVALLRRMLWRVAGRASQESKGNAYRFLISYLLDDERYREWFDRMFQGPVYGSISETLQAESV